MVALFLRGFATSLTGTSLTGHVLGLGFLLESTSKYLGLMLLHMPVPDKKLEHLIQLFHCAVNNCMLVNWRYTNYIENGQRVTIGNNSE